jgi:hypothetical protein
VTANAPGFDRQAHRPVGSGRQEHDRFDATDSVTMLPMTTALVQGGEFGYADQPEAFARKLRDVLDDDN